MRAYILVLLCVLCCAARAEFPPDPDVESAIDGSKDPQNDRDNPFSGTPEEDSAPPPKRLAPHTRRRVNGNERRLTRDGREIDSEEEEGVTEETETVTVPNKKPVVVRLGLYGGYSRLNSSNSTVNGARAAQGLAQTYPLGLNLDARGWKYFGLDLDGYYSIAPTQNIVSGTGATATNGTKQIQVAGGGAMVKLIYPFGHGNTKWLPSLGGGYGYHALTHTEGASGASVVDTMVANGPLIGGGLGVEAGKHWLVNVDFQVGVGGTGTLTETGGTSPFSNTGTGNFMRARIAAAYEVAKNFYLGAGFLYRSMEVALATAPATSTSNTDATQPTGAPETQLDLVLTAQYSF